MSTEPTKIPSVPEIDKLEERLVVENLEVVERVVWGIVRMEQRLKSLRDWYEETRDRRKKKVEYLRRLVESYAVPWRLRTGESTLPITTGTVRVSKGRVVDLSDKALVATWILDQYTAEMAIPRPPGFPRVPVKVTIEPDWLELREWAKWTEDGIGCDPRTGEEIPGLRRGRAEPWHVSIKEIAGAPAHDADEPEIEPIRCDICEGKGRVLFQRIVTEGLSTQELVECGHCRGSGVLGVRDVEDPDDERRSA